jgi:hypothetical protein
MSGDNSFSKSIGFLNGNNTHMVLKPSYKFLNSFTGTSKSGQREREREAVSDISDPISLSFYIQRERESF